MARPTVRRVWNTGRIEKAIHPGLARVTAGSTAVPVTRRFGLLEALNLATDGGLNPRSEPWGFRELARDPRDDGPFGPGEPVRPEAIDPLNPHTGRPDPRVWDYPQSWNLPGNNRREVPWQVLRAAASGVDIIRRCIEVRKAHVADLQWSWSVKAEVIEEAYGQENARGYDDVASELRQTYAAEIKRLTARWERPWPQQDWDWLAWVRSVMEEIQVIDATVVHALYSLGGDVLDLELVDGATIKPLLDHRGVRPKPPYPAFQQEVHGFPRGEWAASYTVDENGNKVVENGFTSSELLYFRANPRLTSPYGLSAVEQSLISARLYLKRQGWMLAEYDDGSTPLTFIETPDDPGNAMTPAQRRDWERSVNGELGGQTSARHRIKVGAPGWKMHQLTSADERYKPDFDLFLVKLVAGHFGVTATELGFSETTGLGGVGWQEGQAEVGGRVGLRPDVKALEGLVNSVSCQFLDCPPELKFTFIDPASENDKESDDVANQQRTRATITVNDDRRRLKLPLLQTKEADMPFLITGTGPVFLEGAFQRAEEQAAATTAAQQAAADGTAGKLELEEKKLDDSKQAREEDREFARETREAEADVQKAAAAEVTAFRTWRKRNPDPKRPFIFKSATPDDWAELAEHGPEVVAFGDDWEWVTDLDKGTWLDWNAANPRKPKGPDGRWVKRGSSLVDALKELSKPDKNSPFARGTPTDADIRAMPDDDLFGMFGQLSQRDTLDEPLMRRLIDDMDRRERATPIPALADSDMTPEQRRVDDLVAGGRGYLSAYAEVHSRDDTKLGEQAAASTVDRHTGETLHQAVRRSYDEWLHIAYLQAEKRTRGNMLNRAGKAAGVDPLDLFTGPVSRARRYASEELLRHWTQQERLNFTQFRAQVLRRDSDIAASERTRRLSNAKDFI